MYIFEVLLFKYSFDVVHLSLRQRRLTHAAKPIQIDLQLSTHGL